MSSPAIRQIILNSLTSRTTYEGNITFPCVPSALDQYERQLQRLFTEFGKPLSVEEMTQVRELLQNNLRDGYQRGGSNYVVVNYQVTTAPTLKKSLGVRVGVQVPTLDEQYKTWAAKRGDNPFGAHPDARVMSVVDMLAAAHPPGTKFAALDVGAGPGRNAIPLARRGLQVDAIEMTPLFSEQLEATARQESLPLRLIHGDLFDMRTVIPLGKYSLACACEVVSHFRYGPPLRDFTERMCESLVPGGYLLYNVFLPRPGYQPDSLAREMAEIAWAALFTRAEVEDSIRGLPLRLVADDSVYDYEQAHLPVSAWPPTRWFEAWSRGWSIFPGGAEQIPPAEMRWLLFQRDA